MMSWESDVRYNQARKKEEEESPYAQLSFYRTALSLSLMVNAILMALVVVLLMALPGK